MPEDEARETWEYLQRCEAANLTVTKLPASGWMVGKLGSKRSGGHGATLRAAYEDFIEQERRNLGVEVEPRPARRQRSKGHGGR